MESFSKQDKNYKNNNNFGKAKKPLIINLTEVQSNSNGISSYLCPKCKQIPIITIQNEEIVKTECSCQKDDFHKNITKTKFPNIKRKHSPKNS